MTKGRLITVGNQAGKTEISAYEHACYALGSHPYKKIRIPNVGWIISAKPLKDAVEKDILPKFHGIVGTNDIVDIRPNPQGIPYKIIWRTGSISYVFSAEQDDNVFEGSTIDHAWFDEPMRREIWVAVMRGLQASGGHWWWSMTPLDEPWVYDEIYTARNKDIEIFEGDVNENKSISKEERDRFKATLTEDEVESRIYGKFKHLAGRVIKEYNPEVHRIPGFDIPRHWPVWTAINPHRRKEQAVLFMAAAPTGVYYVCNEIFLHCTVPELRELVMEIQDQYMNVDTLVDTSAQEEGWQRDSAREMLLPLRTRLAQKKNLVGSGILLINRLFRENKLFVMDHCVRLHRELRLHCYRKSRGSDSKVLEKPEDKWNELIDDLRYILVERPAFTGAATIKERPRPYARTDLPASRV